LESGIKELVVKSKNKKVKDLYRGINELMWSYQPRHILVKDGTDDLPADSHSILLNALKVKVSDFRQMEILPAGLLIPEKL
jgi:hypothetical protein